jgi:hypothetical protein
VQGFFVFLTVNACLCKCNNIPDLSFGEKMMETSFFASTTSGNR